MRMIEKALRGLTVFLSYFSIASTAGMLIISVADVLMRNLFNRPIVGATELVQILNVGIILAMGMGCLTNQNVCVDFVMDRFPRRVQHIVQIAVNLITIAVFALIAWRGCITAADYRQKAYVFSLLKVPKWPFVYVLVLGFAGGILATVLLTVQEIHALRRGEEAGEEGQDHEL